jgi:hypothetical protein
LHYKVHVLSVCSDRRSGMLDREGWPGMAGREKL